MANSRERRAARHNGRGGKKGAYSAKHNDRNFDVLSVDHIDPELMHLNIHQRYAGEYEDAKTNEEYELAFYEDHFRESLDRKNAAYKNKGKSGQIKTMEKYHRSMKSCPEETYYTAGEGVSRELLWSIYSEHQAWKAAEFPQCKTLTADLHADEPNAMIHIHERSVWIGHDKQGMEVVGQAKALAEMGVERPDTSKKTGKHNNAKQTFTKACRENFVQLCKEHGLEIVAEAKPSGEVGLELMEYKIQHAKQRLEALEAPETVKDIRGKRTITGKVRYTAEESRVLCEYAQQSAAALEVRNEAIQHLGTTLDELEEARAAEAAANQAAQELRQKEFEQNLMRDALRAEIAELEDRVRQLEGQNAKLKERLRKMNDIVQGEAGLASRLIKMLPAALSDKAALTLINKAVGYNFMTLEQANSYRREAENKLRQEMFTNEQLATARIYLKKHESPQL